MLPHPASATQEKSNTAATFFSFKVLNHNFIKIVSLRMNI
ncbi:hypothetical protein CHCC20441_4379 [Bacillus licheniformis]|nr:hypothetical protein CHCC20496_3967 [Bacillus licheniformis]TWK02845.1 hypothetical protein CHCC20441_4379 [Bacillus licheniformis]TWK10722.1 hypothetical protein CHCC20440_1201 [Bacillus licheniformis]TWK34857.1 hypothetical protein CHCC20368_1960 [Bacillus licheniformis]TWL62841.1 hypothetical protein CHCC15325_0355 [Bacillus licheniformis]